VISPEQLARRSIAFNRGTASARFPIRPARAVALALLGLGIAALVGAAGGSPGCLRTRAVRARWLIETVPLRAPILIRA
jgi:hypothetical protein